MCQRVQCNYCDWTGTEDDLACIPLPANRITKEREFIKACPNCRIDDYLMDIEQNTCAICDKPISNNKTFCSEKCAKIDLKDTKDES